MDRVEPNCLLNRGDPPSRSLSGGLTARGPSPEQPTGEAGRLALLAALLLQLHQGARVWPAPAVLARAFELLADRLPFDGLRWGLLSSDPSTLAEEHEAVLFQQGRLSPRGPSLTVAHGEPLAACRIQLSVWRDPAGPPFSADDAQLLHCLMPHLVDLWRESRFEPRGDGDGGGGAASGRTPRYRATCDLSGRLQQVDDAFVALIRLEWPQSPAAGLPLTLRRWVVTAAAAQVDAPDACFQGRHITVELHAAGDWLQLVARRVAAVDRLSAHQRDIADRYAGGQSGPQIARNLGLSPSTVDNHLAVVFRKLAVRSKLQLAQRLRETTGSP